MDMYYEQTKFFPSDKEIIHNTDIFHHIMLACRGEPSVFFEMLYT